MFSREPAVTGRGAFSHLRVDTWPDVVYAIGDVHGCLDELLRLEAMIVDDAKAHTGSKLIVMLGDYIDRGPNAAGVIAHLCAPPPVGMERVCLSGNHETMMLAAFAAPQQLAGWLGLGGAETLGSYGLNADSLDLNDLVAIRMALGSHVPAGHLDFLQQLPLSLSLPDTVFVHAGAWPDLPIEEQSPRDLLWMRPTDTDNVRGPLVVHGHTPLAVPLISPRRINVDTGAFATGVLSAVKLRDGFPPSILQT